MQHEGRCVQKTAAAIAALVLAGCAAATPSETTAVPVATNSPHTVTTESTSDMAMDAVTETEPVRSSDHVEFGSPEYGEECSGGRITFEYPPVDLDAIEYITPLGLMTGSHVTPVDHQYYQNFKDPDRVIDVYSPAAGTILDIQHMTEVLADGGGQEISDYRLVIEHTCSITSTFIHVGELAPRIAAVAPPPGESVRVNVAVEAGEVIGSYTKNVDYYVVDLDVTLEGLLVPKTYEREPWKIHTPDPFDYFTEDIRQTMIAKSLRSVEPYGGKFDHDVAGTLAGNWFEEGTNGYKGADPNRYWAGHLSASYDLFDPSHVIISIGTFNGVALQAGVVGNSPDPKDVTVGTGLVMYELVPFEYWVEGERWDRISLAKGIEARNDDSYTYGVVLFQLIDDMTLRVEAIPGANAGDVEGFSAAALVYER